MRGGRLCWPEDSNTAFHRWPLDLLWDYVSQPGSGWIVPRGGSVVPEGGDWQSDPQNCRCWTAPLWCRQSQVRGWGSLLLLNYEWSQLWASGRDDWQTLWGGVLGMFIQKKTPKADLGKTGELTSICWPGNASRQRWWKWLGNRMSGPPCWGDQASEFRTFYFHSLWIFYTNWLVCS